MGRLAMLLRWVVLCVLTLVVYPVAAAGSNVLDAGRPAFPAMTGPVVDDANLLSPQVRQALAQKLLEYARHTSNQIVVVTLPSLHGYPIDEYGYQLGRHWGIGQKGKNNGALLIVDAGGKKVRIEVGYGLEGTLTDAASFEIIHNIIVPRFKRGDFAGGIVAGSEAILSVIGDHAAAVRNAQTREKAGTGALMLVVLLFIFSPLIALFFFRGSNRPGSGPGGPGAGPPGPRGGSGGSMLGWLALGLLSGLGGGGGGFGGGFGGFSGGGGSFGGGGASGGW